LIAPVVSEVVTVDPLIDGFEAAITASGTPYEGSFTDAPTASFQATIRTFRADTLSNTRDFETPV